MSADEMTAAERIADLEKRLTKLALEVARLSQPKEPPKRTGPTPKRRECPPKVCDLIVFARERCQKCGGSGKVENDRWDALWRGAHGDPATVDLKWFMGEAGPGIIPCERCEGFGYLVGEISLVEAVARLNPREVDEARQLVGSGFEEDL